MAPISEIREALLGAIPNEWRPRGENKQFGPNKPKIDEYKVAVITPLLEAMGENGVGVIQFTGENALQEAESEGNRLRAYLRNHKTPVHTLIVNAGGEVLLAVARQRPDNIYPLSATQT